uniref:Uncharacterized protein n=1 Tax=Populus trichocarpa TaxID=3694 RepID=A0A3N7GKS7_POPTR
MRKMTSMEMKLHLWRQSCREPFHASSPKKYGDHVLSLTTQRSLPTKHLPCP